MNNSKSRPVLGYILGIALLIFGVVMFAFSFTAPDALIAYDQIDGSALSTSNAYELKDMIVLDSYAYLEESGKTTDYFIVAFEDANGELYSASFIHDNDKDIKAKLEAYLEDDSQGYGDCVIDACVSLRKITGLDKKIQGYYDEAYELVKDDVTDSGMHFIFVSEQAEDYEAAVKSDRQIPRIGGAVVAVLAIILIFVAHKTAKKQKEQDVVEQVPASPEF